MTPDDPTIESTSAPGDAIPDRIGRYRILGVIGDGGFGRVYEAEQTEPVRRRVALKVIKAGMDSKQVLARFEAERQALAVMAHPGIAKFLDANLTDKDRPYFVMEYVHGIPITDFCEQERLKLDQRVGLMIQVCHAVQHAHMKGVIHRDLKPGNILVELIDKKPVAKVIDFGVAKALAQPLTGSTIYTERGQMIGTAEYMSPEQARGSGVDVDTRADVYSLGAILYELLTGLTPFDSSSLRGKGYAELQRIIEDEEAPRPSLRLTTIAKAPSGDGVPHLRSIDPAAMSKRLKGDMDWIVMKCLEKERDRRYETANGLAMDLQRYLNDEPVVAGPPTVRYRARKFVRRNKALVTGGMLVAAVLVLGMVGTTWGLIEARSQTDRAERELARAVEIKRLVTEMLGSVNPEEALGADTTLLKNILDNTAARLADGEITDELVAAELRNVIGNVYLELGMFRDAERHFPAALEIRGRILGEAHPDTLTSMINLAYLYLEQGRWNEAEPLYLRILELRRRDLGDEHRQTIQTMHELSLLYLYQYRTAEAEALMHQTLELRRSLFGEGHPKTLTTMLNLALLYFHTGRYDESARVQTEAMGHQQRVLGKEHPDRLLGEINLGLLFVEQGKYDDAESIFLDVWDDAVRVLGAEHPHTLSCLLGRGLTARQKGRFDEAEELLLQVVEALGKAKSESHPQTTYSSTMLAELYLMQGRDDEAESLFGQGLAHQRHIPGAAFPDTTLSMNGLAAVYHRQGRLAEAKAMGLEAMQERRRVDSGGLHLAVEEILHELIEVCLDLGDVDEAMTYCQELLDHLEQKIDGTNSYAETQWMMAWVLTRDFKGIGDPSRAIQFAEQACELEQSNSGGSLWKYLEILALAQHMTGDTAAAADNQRRALSLIPEGMNTEAIAHTQATLQDYESELGGDG